MSYPRASPMPAYYAGDIEDETRRNRDYRRVLYTAPDRSMQLVVMCITTEDRGIEREIHDETQLFRVEEGHGTVLMARANEPLYPGALIVVPGGTEHEVLGESSREALQLYTIYTPAHHPDGTCHHRRSDADAAHEKEK